MRRYGVEPTATALQRWIDASGDCWEWRLYTGPSNGGYGRKVWRDESGETRSTTAHRWVYQVLVGDVPDDMDIDHLCRNRSCVNPDHLEPVTRSENVSRGARRFTETNFERSPVCRRGHPYDDAYQDRNGNRRRCRTCTLERNRRWQARQRAKR